MMRMTLQRSKWDMHPVTLLQTGLELDITPEEAIMGLVVMVEVAAAEEMAVVVGGVEGWTRRRSHCNE